MSGDFFSSASAQPIQVINNLPRENLIVPFLTGILAILATISGVGIAEYFRRKDRISLYSREVFKRRLEVYEGLYERMRRAQTEALELIEKKTPSTKKKDIWGPIALEVAGYIDDNGFFLNESVSIHCAGTLIGIEDIKKGSRDYKSFNKHMGEAFDLIKEVSGINKIETYFGEINKPKLNSELIDYYNELKKKYA